MLDLETLEEVFMEKYIDFDDSEEERNTKMDKIINENRAICERLADDLEDGLVIDKTSLIYAMQLLYFAKKCKSN